MRRTARTSHPHHARAVAALVDDVVRDGVFDALVLCGSVGRGGGRLDSDLDVYLLAPQAEYEQRRARSDLGFMRPCDYAGGYVDGKVISLDVLRAVAERGPEPMRASFVGAQVVWSRIGDLDDLVLRAAEYPEAERAANLRDFFAATALHALYFGPQAAQRGNAFQATYSAAQAVLFAGRSVLAYNRVLYPCPKQLLSAVEVASEKPADFRLLMERLLAERSPETFEALFSALRGFTDWGITDAEVLTRFMELDEWRWLTGEPELAQR